MTTNRRNRPFTRVNDTHRRRAAQQALFALMREHGTSTAKLAAFLGIDRAHVYHALNGRITPTLMRVLVRRGDVPAARLRFACEIPDGCDAAAFRAIMRQWAPVAAMLAEEE